MFPPQTTQQSNPPAFVTELQQRPGARVREKKNQGRVLFPNDHLCAVNSRLALAATLLRKVKDVFNQN